MSDMGLGLVGWATAACLMLVILGMVLGFVRMALGPSLADRVVGLDLLTVLMVAFAAAFAIAVNAAAFLDVAIVLALVGFLGTVAFARYAERRAAAERRGTTAAQRGAPAMILDIVVAVLLVSGGAFCFVAASGCCGCRTSIFECTRRRRRARWARD